MLNLDTNTCRMLTFLHNPEFMSKVFMVISYSFDGHVMSHVNAFGADSHPDSVQLSLGIAEQCAKQDKILKFLMSGSDVKELDEFTGQQTLAMNMGTQPYMLDDKLSICEFVLNEPQQYLPEKELVIPDPLLNFVQSLGSALTIDQNGRVLFAGNGDEMRDLLSVFLEFNMSKRETGGCKAAFLVPYFER